MLKPSFAPPPPTCRLTPHPFPTAACPPPQPMSEALFLSGMYPSFAKERERLEMSCPTPDPTQRARAPWETRLSGRVERRKTRSHYRLLERLVPKQTLNAAGRAADGSSRHCVATGDAVSPTGDPLSLQAKRCVIRLEKC